jgi:predicted transcriptional regulator
MIARDLISNDLPLVKTSYTGLKVLNLMDEYRVSHLPIVNNVEFLGLISDTDIYDLNLFDEAIGNHELKLIRPFVKEDYHIYEVIRMVANMDLSIVPVLDNSNNYLGAITLHDLAKEFANITSTTDHLSVLVLEVNVNNYSLAEIAYIVESNGAKVLSSYLSSHKDSTKMEVTLNINKKDLSAIMQSFYRKNYTVTASYHQSEYIDDMKKRYDALMKYLNI